MDHSEPVSSPLSVIPMLGYDDGTAMKELIVSEPAPGELMITESTPRWTRRGILPALGMLSCSVILLTAVVSLARPSPAPEDWSLLAGSIVGLLAFSMALRTARFPDFILVTQTKVMIYKTTLLWKQRSDYNINQIKEIYGLKRLGIQRTIGVLCVRTDSNRTYLFSSCPRQDVFAASAILRQHLGLGLVRRPWYRKPLI